MIVQHQLIDGNIIFLAQETRFTRKKHDPNYFNTVIKISLKDIDYIVFYETPFLKFARNLAFAPKGFQSFSKAMPV